MERLDNGMENVQLYGSNVFCFKAIHHSYYYYCVKYLQTFAKMVS